VVLKFSVTSIQVPVVKQAFQQYRPADILQLDEDFFPPHFSLRLSFQETRNARNLQIRILPSYNLKYLGVVS